MSDLRDLARVFGRIGLISFGGPAAQIALMHREMVETRAWVSEKDYLSALSFCMLLPGPEAMQLATWIGWRRAGVLGGLISGLLFVLPGAAIVMALAMTYAAFGDVPMVKAAFVGVQAAVLAVVIEALLRLSKRALQSRAHWAIAGAGFGALYLLGLPFPVVIMAAALAGLIWLRAALSDAPSNDGAREPLPLPYATSLRAAAIWGAVWLVPLAAVAAFAPSIIADLALFFSKLAMFTFGGAYAVLSWMTSEVVSERGWLTAPQMLDALGLAETTPGPLILVTQFVGYLVGYGQSAGCSFAMGLAGATAALWMTFAPCFLWIFAGAPWIAHLQNAPRARAALAGIMSAVVGVIAHLSLWFAIQTLFAASIALPLGPFAPIVPDLTSLRALPFALAVLAGVLLLHRHWPLIWVLLICASISALSAAF